MDLILRRVVLPDGRLADVGVQDGGIVAIEESLRESARQEIEADGRLLMPAFVNAHLHACKSFWRQELVKLPPDVQALHRFEALGEVKQAYTPQSVLERGERQIRLAIRHGTGAIRLFADVDDQAGLRAYQGLRQLKAKYPFMTIQLVPFPQNGFARAEGNRELLRQAVELGADAVGAVPWLEPTRADQLAHAEYCLDLAREFGLPLHAVADDTEDPASQTGADLAALAARYDWPLLLTQLGSLGFQDDATAARTIELIRTAGATVISNGHIELITNSSKKQPLPKGNTRVRELLAAGVRVVFAQDDIDNPYYPFGRNDLLEVAHYAAHLNQMAWGDELDTVRLMVTDWPAEALNLPEYGLDVGKRADLLLLDAASWAEAVQFQVAKTAVILGGQVRCTERREVKLLEGDLNVEFSENRQPATSTRLSAPPPNTELN
jgi:cytosine/creatinine deaminase